MHGTTFPRETSVEARGHYYGYTQSHFSVPCVCLIKFLVWHLKLLDVHVNCLPGRIGIDWFDFDLNSSVFGPADPLQSPVDFTPAWVFVRSASSLLSS